MTERSKSAPLVILSTNLRKYTTLLIPALKKKTGLHCYFFTLGRNEGNTSAEALGIDRQLLNGIKAEFHTIAESYFNSNALKKALSIVFQKYEQAVIIEENSLPSPNFLSFAHDALDHYREDLSVFGIIDSPFTLPESLHENYPYDGYYFPRPLKGVWATWSNRWNRFNTNLEKLYLQCLSAGIDMNLGGNDLQQKLLDELKAPIKKEWIYNWFAASCLAGGTFLYSLHKNSSQKENFSLPNSHEIPAGLISWQKNEFDIHPEIFSKKYRIQKDSYKVLHISALNHGGAGVAAKRLHEGLLENGIDSRMLVLKKNPDSQRVLAVPDYFPADQWNAAVLPEYEQEKWITQWSAWQQTLNQYPLHYRGLDLFSDERSGISLELIREVREADIINFHWAAGMINTPEFFAKIGKKKIVWTLHDMGPFTGGCHYSMGCEKYKDACGVCPVLGSNKENDLSRLIWQEKKKGYFKAGMNIVTPSKWLGRCAAESSLFNDFPVHTIAYGYALDRFTVKSKTELKKKFNIPTGKKMILFLSDSLLKARKGNSYSMNMLNLATEQEKKDWIIGVYGKLPDEFNSFFGFQIHRFGLLKNEEELSDAYSCADVYVLPTLADNLPNTLIESLACGTPCAAFDIGGVGDIVEHKKNGYLAKYRDSQDLLNGVRWILNESNFNDLQNYGIEKVKREYELKSQAEKYQKLYESLLNADDNASELADEFRESLQNTLSISDRKKKENGSSRLKNGIPSYTAGIMITEDNQRIDRTLESMRQLSLQPASVIVLDASKSGCTVRETDIIRYKKVDHHTSRPSLANKMLDQMDADYALFITAGEELQDDGFRAFIQQAEGSRLPDAFFGLRRTFSGPNAALTARRYPTRYDKGITNPLADFFSNTGLSLYGMLLKKSMLENFGKFNREYDYGWDYEYICRIAEKATFGYTTSELSRDIRERHPQPLAQINESSYYSLLKRNLLETLPLENIFPTLDTGSEEALNAAFTQLNKGFMEQKDYFGAAELMRNLNPAHISLQNLYGLFNASIASGITEPFGDYLSKMIELRTELRTELEKVKRSLENFAFIEQQLEKETAEKNSERLLEIINTIVKSFDYSFLPAYYSGIAELFNNNAQASFSHFFSALLFNPASEEAMKMLKSLRPEEHIEKLIEQIAGRLSKPVKVR